MRARQASAIGSILLCGCYVHTRAQIVDPGFPHARTCPEAVAVFTAPGEVGKKYIEIAHLSVWWPADMGIATPEDVEQAERNKAAKLGANGLILGQRMEGRPVRYDTAVAIFISEDSAHAAQTCAARTTR